MSEQPTALRLADYLTDRNRLDLTCDEAAAELRRLHDVNQELLEALKHAAGCVQDNYLPDKCGHDWDEVIDKAEGQA